MAKAKKEQKPRPDKYQYRLTVNGSFMDIMKASVKNAEQSASKKKEG